VAHDQILVFIWTVTVLSSWGVLTDETTGLSLVKSHGLLHMFTVSHVCCINVKL
jgi:hypothetical protein